MTDRSEITVVVYTENNQTSLDLQLSEVTDDSVQTFIRTATYEPESSKNPNYQVLVALANTHIEEWSMGTELESLLRWAVRLGESIERERVANVLGINHKKGE